MLTRNAVLVERQEGVVIAMFSNSTVRLEILAEELENSGDYAGAEKYLRQVVSIKKNIFGPRHEELIDNLYNLALLCWAQDEYTEAQILLEEALDISCEAHGSFSQESRDIRQALAQLYEETEIEEPIDMAVNA